MSDIVERLRCLDITRQFSGGQHEVINAAIDEIERLREQCEALGDNCIRHGENIHALELENKRLRAALERTHEHIKQGRYQMADAEAREALK